MTMTLEMPAALEQRMREKCAREGRTLGEAALAALSAWVDAAQPHDSVRRLKGVLRREGPAVSLDDMDRAIAAGAVCEP